MESNSPRFYNQYAWAGRHKVRQTGMRPRLCVSTVGGQVIVSVHGLPRTLLRNTYSGDET